jgi:RNA-binding protein PNO1
VLPTADVMVELRYGSRVPNSLQTTMVVARAQPSTSTTAASPRKNRRRITRKHPQVASEKKKPINDNEDAMDDSHTAEAPTLVVSGGDDDQLIIDQDPTSLPHTTSAPAFPPLPASALRTSLKSELRRIPIPPHRMTPLKKDWVNIFGPLTDILGLQVRMNVHRRCVEARVCFSSKHYYLLHKIILVRGLDV